MWPKLNSMTAYQSLKSYCESRKEEDAFGYPFAGMRKSKFVAFQCWAMIQRIKGEEVVNPNIVSTFNAEAQGAVGSVETRTLELVWSYGKSLMAGCAGIQPALQAIPQIPARDMTTYKKLGWDLGAKGIDVKKMTAAVIKYQNEVLNACNVIYDSWVQWEADTFAQEAQALISNPDSLDDLKKLRKLQRERLDGTGLFKAKNASAAGKWKLFPKAKDGLPLVVFSPAIDTDFTDAVKAKVEMYRSGVKSVEYSGTWHQSGNRKSITFSCQSNLPSETIVLAALSSIGVTRTLSVEAKV